MSELDLFDPDGDGGAKVWGEVCDLLRSLGEDPDELMSRAVAMLQAVEAGYFRGDVPSTSSPGAPSMAVSSETSPPAAIHPKGI